MIIKKLKAQCITLIPLKIQGDKYVSVEAKSLFNVGIEQLLLLIDEGHREFLYAVESFQEAVSSHETSYTKLAQIFLQVCTVVRTHYSDEETLMKDVHFHLKNPPAYQDHLDQHRQVLQTLDEFSNRFLLATTATYRSLAQEIDCYFSALQLHIDSHDHTFISLCLAE